MIDDSENVEMMMTMMMNNYDAGVTSLATKLF
jgi:hypothetical protein